MTMKISKVQLTNILTEWLHEYLEKKYSKSHSIEVFQPKSNISKIANSKIKKLDGYSSFEFKPDILGLLEDIETKEISLILLNRSISSISLREIGEMYCYCKLANPEFAFIVSLKGVAEEIQLLLLNKNMEKSILNYTNDNSIILARWNTNNDNLDQDSIFPLKFREEFNDQ